MILGAVWATGCNNTEVLPQLVVGFKNPTINIGLNDSSVSSSVELSRTDASDVTVTLTITNDGDTEYGVDYSTEPAATNGVITLTIQANQTFAGLVINKLKQIDFGATKSFSISIDSVSGNGTAGTTNKLAVTFEENPTSPGATMDPKVGGPSEPNAVYVDLSNQSSTVVARDTYDLAFYTGMTFNVKLNPSVKMLARSTGKTDMTAVTSADTTGWGAQLDFDAIFNAVLGPPPAWIGESSTWIDAPDGDLTKTAISEVSATDANNEVYILNRGVDNMDVPRGWLKIRILQTAGAYKLQFADIDATTFTSVDITKDDNHNFMYYSFENGMIEVTPEKTKWDISFNRTAELADFGTGAIPYMFNDYVNLNPGVTAAMVMISDKSYDAYTKADAETTIFSSTKNLIGSSWRTITGPPDFLQQLNTDRFYVIKDPDGNYYKLKFTKLVNDLGERGNPEITYELL